MELHRAVALFDLEAFIRQTFGSIVESGADELRINCFAPQGCAGADTKHHLWVNVQKKAWICYKCGYGDPRQQPGTGWLVRFLADAEGLSVLDVIQRLTSSFEHTPDTELAEILQDQLEPRSQPKPVPGSITLPRVFQVCPHLEYLKQRGITLEMLRRYDARYCSAMQLRLWHQRVIFPIPNLRGEYVSAVGRIVVDRQPRWQNWPKSDIQSLLWPMGQHRAGVWRPFTPRGVVLLVEGAFDVLGVEAAGFQALATLGKKLSPQQVLLLQQLGVKEVILAWDYDAKSKMVSSVSRLRGRMRQVSVFPFNDPVWRDRDLGDMLRYPELMPIFLSEIDQCITVDSPEYLAWETAVRLE